jgi:purine-cytosine permease-like protein
MFLFPVLVDASLLWLLWAFSKRRPRTLSWLSTYCVITIVFSILFSPFSSEYGQWAWVVQSQFVAETIVCLALFFVLRKQSTTSWFYDSSET